MAIEQFKKLSNRFLDREQRGYQLELLLVGGQTTPWYQLPPGIQYLETVVFPNPTGSGKIQITSDSISKCSENTAQADDWPHGAVTSYRSDTIFPSITAVRAVCVSGDVRIVLTAT